MMIRELAGEMGVEAADVSPERDIVSRFNEQPESS
jgi:hypothetical protein